MAQGSVTITVAYPVTPGDEEDFDVWSRMRLAESAEQPGYLGGEVLAPTRPGPNWLIVHRFEDERAARRWESWFADSPGAKPATAVTWTTEDGPAAPAEPPTQPGLSPFPTRQDRPPMRSAPEPPPRRSREETRVDMRGEPQRDLRDELPLNGRQGRRRMREDEQLERRRAPRDDEQLERRRFPRDDEQQERRRFPRDDEQLERRGRRRDSREDELLDLQRDPPRNGQRDSPRELALEPPTSPRWIALVTLVAVFLAAAFFDAVLAQFLQGAPALVRTAVLALVVTAAVTVVMTPRARRRLRNWLVPIAIRERWQLSEEPPPRSRRTRRKGGSEPGGFTFREPYV